MKTRFIIALCLSLSLFTAQSWAQSSAQCSTEEATFNTCAQKCWIEDSQGNVTYKAGCEPSEICKKEVTKYNECLAKPASSTATSTSTSTSSTGSSSSGASYDNNRYTEPVFDGPGLIGGATYVEGRLDSGVSKERNLKELIIGWTNFLLSIAAIMAVVALVWAGFLYITAFGDDSRMETAKKSLSGS